MNCAVVLGFFLLRPGGRAGNKKVNRCPLMRESELLFFRQGVEINLVLIVSFDATEAFQSFFSEFPSRYFEENPIALGSTDIRLGSDIKNDLLQRYFSLTAYCFLVFGALFLSMQTSQEWKK